MKRQPWLVLAIALLFMNSIHAQQKKNLTPDDYGKWQMLQTADLSANGEWLAYYLTMQEDNDTLFIVNRLTNQLYKLEFGSYPKFSRDNQWVAFQVGLPYKEAEKMREQKLPIRNKMCLLNLRSGKKEYVQEVGGYDFSRNSKFLAISLLPPKESRDKGSVLLLRNLADSSTRTIGNVSAYSFNRKSDYLAYIVQSANSAGNSIELFNLNTYNLKVIASDTLNYSRLAWQKDGDAFVFCKNTKNDSYEEENAIIYACTNIYKLAAMKVFDPSKVTGFPAGMRIDGSNISITDDGGSVGFNIARWTAKPKKDEKKPSADSSKIRSDSARTKADTTKGKPDVNKNIAAKTDKKDEKPAGVDIWHWKDGEIQPRQKLTYTTDKDTSYAALWHPANDHFIQVSNPQTPSVSFSYNKKLAIVSSRLAYKPAFKEDFADYYIVNTTTGEQKLLLKKMLADYFGAPSLSPEGKYVTYFKDQQWWSYNTSTGETVNLTQSLNTPFWNTRDDHPAVKPPFGAAGWTKGDAAFLVYDEYNVWALDPNGKAHRKITNGEQEEVQYRYIRTNFENPYIDEAQPVYFSAYGDKSKKTGFGRLEKGKFQVLDLEDRIISRLTKAEDAAVFAYMKQDYNVSPELYANDQFKGEKRIAVSNPQQQDYYWGKSELVSFTNKKGKKMQGALFYPANYEPGKQYPMIVYIYEILSNSVHSYVYPSIRSSYNTTNFTTNGYFIFRPDIVYDINDPGMSAVDCVVPAVETVLKTGMIDKNKVGLMGHSWGAYQTSFIITQTDLFKAACAGAPLTDLISMSLSIYWNSGTPDQKIFETSQGRFDGPWYERMEAHMRNSPMFQADKIKTPLLVAFGDKDGAVDWHQGIEMYGTLRRMQKEHVMLVYADENHGLVKRENQIDYTRRQKEWFDHFLLGKPAAKWITEGVSYVEKMKEQGSK